MRSAGNQSPLELRIEGVGGDLVSDVTHVTGTLTTIPLSEKRPQCPKEPTYRIARADGKVVAVDDSDTLRFLQVPTSLLAQPMGPGATPLMPVFE